MMLYFFSALSVVLQCLFLRNNRHKCTKCTVYMHYILFMPCVYEASWALPPFETFILNHLCQTVFSKEAHI